MKYLYILFLAPLFQVSLSQGVHTIKQINEKLEKATMALAVEESNYKKSACYYIEKDIEKLGSKGSASKLLEYCQEKNGLKPLCCYTNERIEKLENEIDELERERTLLLQQNQ